MKHRFLLLSLIAALAAAFTALADEPSLDAHLEPLRPLLEKTWTGQFKDSTPDKPMIDIARWERALNGKAIRILHSVNNGIYGGESLVMWDDNKRQVTFHYFTTAGFMTTGNMRFEQGKTISHELVTGNKEGVTEVRATSELRPDGTLHVRSEYLKNGEWMPGHEITYREDKEAKVVFR
ncbi:MAG: hypothetical protein AB9869_26545 [Verrucomicrobiia bacterium]